MHCPYCSDKGRYDGCPGCGRFSSPKDFAVDQAIKQGQLPDLPATNYAPPGITEAQVLHPNRPSNIEANSNSIENGASDPTPEAGKGGLWRASVSWLKGWFN